MKVIIKIAVPRQLLPVQLVEARQLVGGSGLLMGGRGERGGGLVAVGGGRRGGVGPVGGRGSVLAALHQVGPLGEGRAPLFIRATNGKEEEKGKYSVSL